MFLRPVYILFSLGHQSLFERMFQYKNGVAGLNHVAAINRQIFELTCQGTGFVSGKKSGTLIAHFIFTRHGNQAEGKFYKRHPLIFILDIMKRLVKPENAAEAEVIRRVLAQHDIFARVDSFYDTAYDGLFQIQRGWGVIMVSEDDYNRAAKIIEDWKASAPSDIPWNQKE